MTPHVSKPTSNRVRETAITAGLIVYVLAASAALRVLVPVFRWMDRRDGRPAQCVHGYLVNTRPPLYAGACPVCERVVRHG